MPQLANAFDEKVQKIIDGYRAGKITADEARRSLFLLNVPAIDAIIKLAEPQPRKPGGNGGQE